MQSLSKIKFSLISYWIGCLIGGLILGITFGKFTGTQRLDIKTNSDDISVDDSIAPVATETTTQSELVTIIFTGDVMLGRSVNGRIISNNNPTWPFEYVKDFLRSADITYINLESPLISECPITESGMKFCGNTANVQGLVDAGVDVASLANNHATNYGQEGLDETINTLTSHGINAVGMGPNTTINQGGYDYHFLSYNDAGKFSGISQADATHMETQIRAVSELGGLVVVGFHWGEEYQSEANSRQKLLAHSAIDAGADLVIGSHPHWVQPSEIYKDKPIYYSLGNFVFDQEWSKETKTGLVVRFSYRGNVLDSVDELPVTIENYGQPMWQ